MIASRSVLPKNQDFVFAFLGALRAGMRARAHLPAGRPAQARRVPAKHVARRSQKRRSSRAHGRLHPSPARDRPICGHLIFSESKPSSRCTIHASLSSPRRSAWTTPVSCSSPAVHLGAPRASSLATTTSPPTSAASWKTASGSRPPTAACRGCPCITTSGLIGFVLGPLYCRGTCTYLPPMLSPEATRCAGSRPSRDFVPASPFGPTSRTPCV